VPFHLLAEVVEHLAGQLQPVHWHLTPVQQVEGRSRLLQRLKHLQLGALGAVGPPVVRRLLLLLPVPHQLVGEPVWPRQSCPVAAAATTREALVVGSSACPAAWSQQPCQEA